MVETDAAIPVHRSGGTATPRALSGRQHHRAMPVVRMVPAPPHPEPGIAGDTIADLTARLDTAINDPIAISLLIGTNDLGGGFPGFEQPLTDPRQIADSFAGLVSEIRDRVPVVPLLINSVMPREERFTPNILALNEDYQQIAERAKAHYVDLWPDFADGEVIKSEYSRDLLHLNGPGYRAWTSLLAPVLEALGRTS